MHLRSETPSIEKRPITDFSDGRGRRTAVGCAVSIAGAGYRVVISY